MGDDDNEAEYAWLPVDYLKPFKVGDTGVPVVNPAMSGELAALTAAAVAAGASEAAAAASAAALLGGGSTAGNIVEDAALRASVAAAEAALLLTERWHHRRYGGEGGGPGGAEASAPAPSGRSGRRSRSAVVEEDGMDLLLPSLSQSLLLANGAQSDSDGGESCMLTS